MRRHLTIAAFALALAAYSPAQKSYRDSQDQSPATQSNAQLSKKDRKRMEKEEKKARKQERKEEKRVDKQEAKEQRKRYKEEEKRAAMERKHERKVEGKEVAKERRKDEKYERKEAQRAEKEEVRDRNRHIERETRAAAVPPPRYGYVPRIPISTTATPGLLMAQREVSRAIYSQAPGSDVRVLLDNGNRILLRGSAPTPSLKQRLLQVAMGAARGYSVVDELAANLVSDAAGAATSAAIGGVSDLIHGHGSSPRDTGPQSFPEPGPDSGQQAPAYSQQALPNSDRETMATVLDPGSNACVNLSSSSQTLLTGQVASQSSAELIRRFAHQLASPSVPLVDQLAVRTTGIPDSGNAPQDVRGGSSADTANTSSPPIALSPGSTVCVGENSGQIFLTGTVGSTAELGAVENAVQPLVGNGRLLDQLTIGTVSSGTQIAAASPPANIETTPVQQNEVEQALHSVPRLANVNVQVAADGVHLSGSVDTAQDDQMAADLAREYAPGRAVLDNMTVANRIQPPQ